MSRSTTSLVQNKPNQYDCELKKSANSKSKANSQNEAFVFPFAYQNMAKKVLVVNHCFPYEKRVDKL